MTSEKKSNKHHVVRISLALLSLALLLGIISPWFPVLRISSLLSKLQYDYEEGTTYHITHDY